MDSFFNYTELGLNHIQVIVRGMYAVAESDGVHQSEMVMLKEFYETCRRDADGLADFKDLISQPFDPAEAKEILDTNSLKETFIKSCFLLAFADGKYTDPEKKIVADMAQNLDMPKEQTQRLEEAVKDHLLVQISRIQNVDALKEVASKMK